MKPFYYPPSSLSSVPPCNKSIPLFFTHIVWTLPFKVSSRQYILTFFPTVFYQPGKTPLHVNQQCTFSTPPGQAADDTVENPQAHAPADLCPYWPLFTEREPYEDRDHAYHVLCVILSHPQCPSKEATQTYIDIPTEWSLQLQCGLEMCISQDGLSYAEVTNSPQMSVASNDRSLFPMHTLCLQMVSNTLPYIVLTPRPRSMEQKTGNRKIENRRVFVVA